MKSLLLSLLILPARADVCGVEWDAVAGAVDYRVWRGTELLATVTVTTAQIELPTDQLSTITVTARNAESESAHSEPITVLPVVPQSSPDLVTWQNHPAFFELVLPELFFRFSSPRLP